MKALLVSPKIFVKVVNDENVKSIITKAYGKFLLSHSTWCHDNWGYIIDENGKLETYIRFEGLYEGA